MRHTLLCVTVYCALVVPLGRAQPEDSRSFIVDSYRRGDQAYGRADIDGVFKAHTPDCVVVDQMGKEHRLSELRAAILHSWRTPPNMRAVARQSKTQVESVVIDGDLATVRGIVDAEVAMIDTAGTAADGHDLTDFEDHWAKTPSGWKITSGRVLSSKRAIGATPSEQMRAATALIRQNTQNMMDFDRSVNFSDCMESPAMRRYTVERRREVCAR